MTNQIEVKIENGRLIVSLPINKYPSATGKTTVIASTHGNQPTTATVDGKPVILGVNAYIK